MENVLPQIFVGKSYLNQAILIPRYSINNTIVVCRCDMGYQGGTCQSCIKHPGNTDKYNKDLFSILKTTC